MRNNRALILILAIAAACTWSCLLCGCFSVMMGRGREAEPAPSPLATETVEAQNAPALPAPTSLPPTHTPAMASPTPRPEALRTEAKVISVIDGDTIEVEVAGETYHLRYIGIDAPERQEPGGPEATEANRLLVDGQLVQLEKDVSDTDEYGRLLRYVYVGGIFVNARLVERGYARAVSYSPDVRYDGPFTELQSEAQAAGIGVWAEPTPLPPTPTLAPTATPTLVPATATPPAPTSTPVPPPPPTPTAGRAWNCNGNLYNCDDFSSCAEVMSYWYACPGDPSRLDGDHDGRPCESLCR
jgi:micrococcal nuclease